MSKIRRKFIITTIFCSIFLSITPIVAMKNNKKISIKGEDKSSLTKNNKNLNNNQKKEFKKENIPKIVEIVGYYSDFFDLILQSDIKKDSYDSGFDEDEYIKIDKSNSEKIEKEINKNETLLAKWKKSNNNNYYYKRIDLIENYIEANKGIKVLDKIKKENLGNEDNEQKKIDYILKKMTEIMPKMEEKIKQWRMCYNLDEQGKKIREACDQIQANYFHLSNIYNRIDYSKKYYDSTPIIKLGEIKESVWKYFNIKNEKELDFFKSSEIYKKRYISSDKQEYCLSDLKEDIKNIIKVQKDIETYIDYLKKIKKDKYEKEGREFIVGQFDKLFEIIRKKIQLLSGVIKGIDNFFGLGTFEEIENENLKKYDLDDLSELNLNETKEGIVRIKSLKQSDSKTYNISDKLSLLDLYIEQLNCYKYHFSNLYNKKIRIKEINEPLKNKYLKLDLEIENDLNNNLKNNNILFTRYIKKENEYLYERKNFIEDYFRANKIIEDLKNLIKLIDNSEENNNEDLKEKKNKANVILKEIKIHEMNRVKNEFIDWRYTYALDEDGEKINRYQNQIKVYFWHLYNIWKNIAEKYNSNNKNPDNNIIELK